ncbi:glycosyl transferase family 90-domain-containing protein [Mycena belliarum]|uniref:Glycosyl transferase family 90-domain-containing protein n=1 Tax=Mycena belliarum TaxID=1033014 RepID=A0AAD6U0G1_9AGAR|nr:glycosyl transferase family 90-domain-containing protein [Mycena belliae]
MASPMYTVLRRRSLRRPAIILIVVFTVAFMARFMRDIVFDAQHSTSIAFKLASGRTPPTVTLTEWATRTVKLVETPKPKKKEIRIKDKPRRPPLGQHTYRADGLLEVNPLGAHPIFELVERAEAAWAAKLAAASTSLRAAAAEYTRRYGRRPPRGFDAWWAYAAAHDVPLPDEYDQIDRDLAHFYGVAPADLRAVQRDWEAHADSYTLGKDAQADGISMLNFTLPADERVRLELAAGAFQIIDLLADVEHDIPPFRAVFSPHDNPNLATDYELKKLALDAAAAGRYIDVTRPPPQKHGWPSACPPLSPAQLNVLPPPFDDARPNTAPPSVPGSSSAANTFIHAHLPAMDPCLHPAHLAAHGQYLAHGAGPTPHRALIPQFSYSVTPLHSDIRPATPLNWVPDDIPNEGRAPPLGFAWEERTDERLQWRGSNTGIWHAPDGRWREAQRIRLAALASGRGGANLSVLMVPGPGSDPTQDDRAQPVGPPRVVSRARYVHALLDVALAGAPVNGDEAQRAVITRLFEFRAPHDLQTAGRYKYVLDVDGNGWSSRFKRLMNSGSLIFKATAYPEWFTDRIAPWVHYVPVQNSYVDLFDALVFFRGDPAGGGAHDDMARRIAAAGREWSRRYWRKEDLTAYMYRLFLEYARVMSADRGAMSFVMWEDVGDDKARERALMERWSVRRGGAAQEDK